MSKLDRSRICFGTYYSYLKRDCGVKEASSKIVQFADGEISVKFLESLRNKHLFIFGETTRNLTELLLTIDAAKRSSVREITVVLPYYGYSRQDKREGSRGCLGASMIAQVLQSVGIDRLMTIDLHAEQIQGYFHGLPVEHIIGKNMFVGEIQTFRMMLYAQFGMDIKGVKIVTPDAGGTLRAGRIADALDVSLVTIHKRRSGPGVIASMELYGDVAGTDVIIVDDIADSCGTLAKAGKLLKDNGARKVIALATHPVLSENSLPNIESSVLDGMVLANTLKFNPANYDKKIVAWDCMEVLNEAITSVALGESISHLTSY